MAEEGTQASEGVLSPEEMMEEDDDDEYVTLNMHQIVENLWIGDFLSSQQYPILRELGIKHVIAAMRQKYKAPDDFELHRVLVEDTNRTNMLAHVEETSDIIRRALKAGEGILVHCQAGVSRSTTLVAAYLMREHSLTADDAIAQISAIRSQVEPTEFFLHQLEMFERMNYEVDPAKHAEYRRFLMNFNHNEIMSGDGTVDQMFLAYYPSPAITPRERSLSDPFGNLRMSAMPSTTNSPDSYSPIEPLSRRGSSSSIRRSDLAMTPGDSSEAPSRRGSSSSTRPNLSMTPGEPIRRRRSRLSNDLGMKSDGLSMTSSKPATGPQDREEIVKMLHKERESSEKGKLARRPSRIEADRKEGLRAEARKLIEGKEKFLKVGQGRVVIKGRRIRCRMCRRELAAREHIVEHEAGRGQQAFAPRRRDMVQHRLDAEKRKNAATPAATLQERRPMNLAALRVAMPQSLSTASVATETITDPSAVSADPKEAEASDCAIEDDDDTSPPSPPSPPLLCSTSCSSYFVEPLSWMSDQLETGVLGGKLMCPDAKCRAKLGNFDWAGLQCSCGAWVVPAFSIAASKVDEVDF